MSRRQRIVVLIAVNLLILLGAEVALRLFFVDLSPENLVNTAIFYE